MDLESSNKKTVLIIMGALLLMIILTYFPVLRNDFINFDDTSYVTANPRVQEGLTPDSIRWAFTTFHFYNWHPVTWLSHMLDVSLFGLDPAGHHGMSLLMHAVNSLLLFGFLRTVTGATGKSLVAAALFALHPLHVEPVAWVSGRKDLLSTLFGLLTLFAYVRYTRALKASSYVPCLLLFSVSLMAKPMLMTMPVLLLLMDFWPLGRMSASSGEGRPLPRLLTEKIPFLVLAIISGVVSYYAQQQAREIASDSSVVSNISLAAVNYCRYVLKMLWPLKLAAYYPYSPVQAWQAGLALGVLVTITAGALWYAKRLPWLAFGWFWYLVALAPAAGFVRIGQHSMADRYTYVPLIGLFVVLAWGGAAVRARARISPKTAAVVFTVVILGCALLSNRQASRWRDSETLFRYTLEVTENNSLAHKNLGAALAAKGDLSGALYHVTESLRLQPEPLEYVSQAWLRLQLGDYVHAAESAKNSLAMMPDNNEKAHFLLGVAYASLNDIPSAMKEYSVLSAVDSPYAARLYEVLGKGGHMP